MGYLLPTDARTRVRNATNLEVRIEYEPGYAVLVVESPYAIENRFVFKLASNTRAPRKVFAEASIAAFIVAIQTMP